MRRLRGARYLTCFYCGKRSGLKFDGTVRDFLCQHCDATNYLDQNGDITDPPVATELEAGPIQFAATQPSKPSRQDASQGDDIFCQKCLKNQHLFTKSLAQYLPDDPSDPEYPQLERNYHRYRRNLEARYPQVCSQCVDKVEGRIRQAGYTAKTDHLRRMMNLSRGRRTQARTRLDLVDALGKSTWRAALALQMMWHFVMMTQALQDGGSGARLGNERGVHAAIVSMLGVATAALPRADFLMTWSVRTCILAAWWNPHFVQMMRGFTRHLLGFAQWYSFQGLIVFSRFVFRSLDLSSQSQSATGRLGAHVAMATAMVLIYAWAGKSIREDTTPLFATHDRPLTAKRGNSSKQGRQKDDSSKTFSESFHDALDFAGATPQKMGTAVDMTPSPQSTPHAFRPMVASQLARNWPETPSRPTQQQQQLQYGDEMDWSPVVPQYRALSEMDPSSPHNQFAQVNAGGGGGGGGVPVHQQESKNPFWFKVPAAPVDPARRLRNPVWPKQEVPLPDTNKVFFSAAAAARKEHENRSSSQQDEIGSKVPNGNGNGGVEFRQPRFFAPEQDDHHDASSLADLLGQSFSLGQEQDDDTRGCDKADYHSAVSTLSPRHKMVDDEGEDEARRRSQRRTELTILSIALSAWIFVLLVPRVPYQWETQLATLLVTGVVAVRGSGDTSHHKAPGPAAYALSALGLLQLAAICWIGSEIWNRPSSHELGWHGAGVLASVLGHWALSTIV